MKLRYDTAEKLVPARDGKPPRIEQRGRAWCEEGTDPFTLDEAVFVAQVIETSLAPLTPGFYRWIAEYDVRPEERTVSYVFVCVPFMPLAGSAPQPSETLAPAGADG